jgi:chemotaxis protein CheZ
MPTTIAELRDTYGELIETLRSSLDEGDELAFFEQLDELVHIRERSLFTELRKLTRDLHNALERFRLDSRLVDLAEKEVPDARQRLDHVLKLTDEAAHKTMDLVEQSGPLAERTAKEAADLNVMWRRFRAREIVVSDFRVMLERMDVFLNSAQTDNESIRRNLAEVLLTQGYQDLTGQIIRGVMKLVTELEGTLGDLVRLSATDMTKSEPVNEDDGKSRGYGPAVPGVDHGVVVSGQQDVDALLSGLGM